ncbi:MAG: orotate phosphoribosyltransferase [Proteobacteria bacterium]|nr:orotate phosphoribosyltransferase [Pseudomonadota bacterium]
MHSFQTQFLDYCLDRGVLKFGQFTLKSGRVSPYFFNAGLFNTGADLVALGAFYAEAIDRSRIEFDLLFGPAYKGIPLAAVTASALYQNYQRNFSYAFNRKETKDHGEGGNIVGAPIQGRVMIIDDVITAGTAIRQSMQLIESLGASVCAVTIALDRQEKGLSEQSAVQELEQTGIPIIPIIRLEDILLFLQTGDFRQHLQAVKNYRDEYGID